MIRRCRRLTHDDFVASPVAVCFMISQKAESLTKIPVPTDDMKKVVLEQRRCIILGLVGSTPSASPSIERILASGYLDYVKVWLDDILSGKAGEFVFSTEKMTLVCFSASGVIGGLFCL